MGIVLKSEQLSRTFIQGEHQIRAVHNVSLSFEEGKFYAITGPSGCGKTTLLHLLGALDLPTDGEVYYRDTPLYQNVSAKVRADMRLYHISCIFQNYNLISIMTAYENIVAPCIAARRKADADYLGEICEVLGIADRLNHIPSELSGGEQQRVATARAIIMHPDVLLADEPTGNLDKESAEELLSLLLDLQKRFSQTIIMVTHDTTIAERADIHIKMEDGQIVSMQLPPPNSPI